MKKIVGGRVIDPESGADEVRDIYIDSGYVISEEDARDRAADLEYIDASKLIVAPGLVDMHVHLRDPGFVYKEDIFSGAAAAAAGGFTTVCCMPNTAPVADNPDTVRYIVERARDAIVRVIPYAAVTAWQKGEELTDFRALRAAGAIAFSDDGNCVQNAAVQRLAMQNALRDGDLLIISHCEDSDMVKNFAVNEGTVSKRLGIPGRPAIAEYLMIERDILIARETGARLHIAHVSTATGIEFIRRAKADGVRVTCETCPQYFTLTEEAIEKQGSLARVNPPLRTDEDVRAVIDGIKDGTIDAIATDHAPHATFEKERSIEQAPSGMIGLETALAASLTKLWRDEGIALEKILGLLSFHPADILGIPHGGVRPGDLADLVIFDPYREWTVDPAQFKSKSANTPFTGTKLNGRVICTICGGNTIYTERV